MLVQGGVEGREGKGVEEFLVMEGSSEEVGTGETVEHMA